MVFCPGLQQAFTKLYKDCLLHEGEGFCIVLRRLKVDFQVQVLRKRVQKYMSRDQGLEKSSCQVQVALPLRYN